MGSDSALSYCSSKRWEMLIFNIKKGTYKLLLTYESEFLFSPVHVLTIYVS